MNVSIITRPLLLRAICVLYSGALLPQTAYCAEETSISKRASVNTHRVLTCNILLDLPEHKGKPEDWNGGRRELCMKVMKSRNADIYCLQEVGRSQHADFARAFPDYASSGYADPYVDTNPVRFQAIKNVILYRKERYEQISAGLYWMSETPLIAGSRLPGEKLARHVAWVRLRDRITGREFRVLDTHFALQQPVRLKQAAILTSETAQYAADFPQILTGDFNSDSTSAEHKVLTDVDWVDSYAAAKGTTDAGITGHGFKGLAHAPIAKHGQIDFIFVRGKIISANAEIIRDHDGEVYPSDHFFVLADLEL